MSMKFFLDQHSSTLFRFLQLFSTQSSLKCTVSTCDNSNSGHGVVSGDVSSGSHCGSDYGSSDGGISDGVVMTIHSEFQILHRKKSDGSSIHKHMDTVEVTGGKAGFEGDQKPGERQIFENFDADGERVTSFGFYRREQGYDKAKRRDDVERGAR